MNNQKGPVPPHRRRRRERTVFHYKVDEDLRPADREAYLALLRDARTRNEDAHRWLIEHGYALSLSAVARHRRRLLASEARDIAALRKAELFARLAGSDDAPDFAGGARVQLQHIVFERLIDLDERSEIDSGELLRLTKVVAQCGAMQAAALRAARATPAPSSPASPPAGKPPSDEELREQFIAIALNKPARVPPPPPPPPPTP